MDKFELKKLAEGTEVFIKLDILFYKGKIKSHSDFGSYVDFDKPKPCVQFISYHNIFTDIFELIKAFERDLTTLHDTLGVLEKLSYSYLELPINEDTKPIQEGK